MNKPLIIDSSAFISLGSVSDSNYQKAVTISGRIEETGRTVIMPGDIVTEIINVVGKKVGHEAATMQAHEILSSKAFTIVEINPSIRSSAFIKFKKQPSSVSFTDCIVMAFADEYETKDIFGFDEAFRKNGYKRVGIDK